MGYKVLQYNGRANRMADIPANRGCDGANSTYNVKCDWWYMWANCKDLEDGKNLTVPPEAERTAPHMAKEITADQCSQSQWVAAMKKYLASPEYDVDFPPPTDAPTAMPTPKPTTTAAPTPAPATPAPTSAVADVQDSSDSNCRLQAMAALAVWLMSVLQ
jgi:hypothetical protein